MLVNSGSANFSAAIKPAFIAVIICFMAFCRFLCFLIGYVGLCIENSLESVPKQLRGQFEVRIVIYGL